MTSPVIPDYGRSTLADVLPSIAAQFGRPGDTNVLGLPEAERYVVLLVDGLGAQIVREWAPALGSLGDFTIQALTSGIPSTTATSITSLGTGLPPGAHGVAGYVFRYEGALLNALSWRPGAHALDVQPQLTYFERLSRLGVSVTTVNPERFRGSGLTTCALRGAQSFGLNPDDGLDKLVTLTVQGATSGGRSLTYVYAGSLDSAGHTHGVGSDAWRRELAQIDRMIAALRARLPADVRLLVTGDHGMVNVPADRRVIVEEVPTLLNGVAMLGGEPRLRHLYALPGQAEGVAVRWRELVGDVAWVRTRDEAIAEGWFGDVDRRWADRFGDVLAACRDDAALMSLTEPKSLSLVGMHGSLTEAEVAVPLAVG